jgi:hypothetical protein
MATHGEKVLALELLGFVAIQTGDALYTSGQSGQKGQLGGPTLPNPSQYFAGLIVFTMLAAVAAFSERWGRFAGAFGGLALLALALRPNNSGGTPPVVGFLKWLAQMYQSPPATLATPGGTGSVPAGSTPVAGGGYVAPQGPLQSLGGAVAAVPTGGILGGLQTLWNSLLNSPSGSSYSTVTVPGQPSQIGGTQPYSPGALAPHQAPGLGGS